MKGSTDNSSDYTLAKLRFDISKWAVREAHARHTKHDPLTFALENVRLRARIRKLEKQISDSQPKPAPQKQAPAPNTVSVQQLNVRASYDGFRC